MNEVELLTTIFEVLNEKIITLGEFERKQKNPYWKKEALRYSERIAEIRDEIQIRISNQIHKNIIERGKKDDNNS